MCLGVFITFLTGILGAFNNPPTLPELPGDYTSTRTDVASRCLQYGNATFTAVSGRALTRSTSFQGPRVMPAKARRATRRRRCSDVRKLRAQREQKLEGIISSLFKRFFFGQGVVFGELPLLLPRGQVHVVSENMDVPPYCWHVRCSHEDRKWPTALALQGFDWRESTVWLLRMQGASDPALLRLLRTVATMSAPRSVVLLVSWSSLAVQMADEAGFSLDVVQYGKPLYILRRKERRARCEETDSPYTSPPHNPPPEPAFDGWMVQFELRVDSLPAKVRDRMAAGSIRVVGNSEELGNWDVESGVCLSHRGYVFCSDMFVSGGEVGYKYVFRDANGEQVWESGDNRTLPESGDTLIRVTDRWRS